MDAEVCAVFHDESSSSGGKVGCDGNSVVHSSCQEVEPSPKAKAKALGRPVARDGLVSWCQEQRCRLLKMARSSTHGGGKSAPLGRAGTLSMGSLSCMTCMAFSSQRSTTCIFLLFLTLVAELSR